MHARVEITNGDHVGTVTAIARDHGGRIEGLEVSLDSGKLVWIDASDARFNRTDGILMTDLNRAICIGWPTNASELARHLLEQPGCGLRSRAFVGKPAISRPQQRFFG